MAKRKLKKKVKKRIGFFILFILIVIFIIVASFGAEYYFTLKEELIPVDQKKEYYNISDFGYIRLTNNQDQNNNGKDDYTDILEGEKQFAKFNPKYKSDYYAGGYPPVEKEGVCTDLIWYALKNAGYNLKDMIDKDIKQAKKEYYIQIPDTNIDFRRVANQEVFFIRNAKTLDTDMYNVGEFMPGDILTFDNSEHIAMVSDKYTKDGVPYLIQNRDETQKEKEENRLEITDMKITGHYRFEYNNKIKKLLD